LVKEARPDDAFTVVVPPRVPPLETTEIGALDVVTRFPPESRTATVG